MLLLTSLWSEPDCPAVVSLEDSPLLERMQGTPSGGRLNTGLLLSHELGVVKKKAGLSEEGSGEVLLGGNRRHRT